MVDVVCPLCGQTYKGLNLEETGGWFICQKYGTDVMLPQHTQTQKIPLYSLEELGKRTLDQK